jgi:hypothetical protein
MKTIAAGAALILALTLRGSPTWGQELVPTPDPVASPSIGGTLPGPGGQIHSGVPANPAPAAAADDWRYLWNDGCWWYWTPQNRWMWYRDGRWLPYDGTVAAGANSAPLVQAQAVYAPPVAVGVRPYGDVHVGVGRRIEVNVWGGHGGVRVGPIAVGW